MKEQKLLGNAGQSTVEFALTLILLISFLFFFFQLSMVFAFGSYVHYATFMSARAYLSAGTDLDDQKTRAKYVLVGMLKKSQGQSGIDKFPSIGKGVEGDPPGFKVDPPNQYKATDENYSWLQGVRYTFRSRLFMIPLAGLGAAGSAESGGSVNSVTLTSESWLGREPAWDECEQDMANNQWFFDNGC